MIRVTCDECSASFKVKDDRRGKALKCAKCGAKIVVPDDGSDDGEAGGATASDASDVTEAVDDPKVRAKRGARAAGMAAQNAAAETRDRFAEFSGTGGGGLGAIMPPKHGGAVTLFYIGIVLLITSFGLKQVWVDWMIRPGIDLVEEMKLAMEQDAEIADLRENIDDIDVKLQFLRPGPDADSDEKKDIREEREELQKEQEELQKDLEEDMMKIRKSYAEDGVGASIDTKDATASAISRFQWALSFKLLVDLLKFAGAALVILSALGISLDPKLDTPIKAYAIVCGGVAFALVGLGGLFALV